MSTLCRLCAKVSTHFKNLLENVNKGLREVVTEYTHIIVHENDNLPTAICIDCEETLVNFQLFVLECQKTQDIIKSTADIRKESELKIKLEDDLDEYNLSLDKVQVKDEYNADVKGLFSGDQETCDDAGEDFVDDNCINEDDFGDIALAALKKTFTKTPSEQKKRVGKKKKSNEINQHNQIATFVKLNCPICDINFKSWDHMKNHFDEKHMSTPSVSCLCGYEIRSKSVLYRHVSEHVLENKSKYPTKNDDGQAVRKYDHHVVTKYIKFTCPDCKEEFSSWYKLKAHCEETHDIAPIAYCSCGFEIRSKSSVYKHVRDHEDSSGLRCDTCGKVTKSEKALEKHKLRHIPKSERQYQCSKCDKVFRCKENLKSHEKTHIPIDMRRNYDCEVCGMKFTTRFSATAHRRIIHDKVKGFVCDQCGYTCATGGELRQHRAIHSNEKPFTCSQCSKGFKTYANWKTHMDTHDGTSYECSICRRVLNSRRTLRKHYLVHDDKRRHVCPYCKRDFKRRQTLVVHLLSHTGLKPISCNLCGEKFSYASTLRTHKLRVHPETVQPQTSEAQTHNAQEIITGDLLS